MSSLSLKNDLYAEIELIPEDKLAEVYNFLHYFRLGLNQEKETQFDSQQAENNLSPSVLEAFNASLTEFDELYQELAK